MAEEIIEFNGAGFIPGVPGEFANCQVVFDSETKEVLRVEPIGTAEAIVPSEYLAQVQLPSPGVLNINLNLDTTAQPEVQSAEQENQGG